MEREALPLQVTVDLSDVQTSDQPLIRDVCAVLATVYRHTGQTPIDTISVTTSGAHYLVVASFKQGAVTEIYKSDLDAVADVNPLRVSGIALQHDGSTLRIKVKVCGMNFPVTVTDTELVRVVKKRRWAFV